MTIYTYLVTFDDDSQAITYAIDETSATVKMKEQYPNLTVADIENGGVDPRVQP